MQKRISFPKALIVSLLLTFLGAVTWPPVPALAVCKVTVVNQTGYDMEPLKLVQEAGASKMVVGKAPMANGKSQTFEVSGGGQYRAYGLLTKDGEKKYAKGNLYTLEDGNAYTLTLQKLVISEKSNSISFISKDEFESLQ